MTDMELFLSADCRCDGLVDPRDCDHPPAYYCHWARAEVARRGLDLAEMRTLVERASAEIRKLDDEEILFLSVVPDPAGLWRVADRVLAEEAGTQEQHRERTVRRRRGPKARK